jgi:hypothetical protein
MVHIGCVFSMLVASRWLKDRVPAVRLANADKISGIISADSLDKCNLIFLPDFNS